MYVHKAEMWRFPAQLRATTNNQDKPVYSFVAIAVVPAEEQCRHACMPVLLNNVYMHEHHAEHMNNLLMQIACLGCYFGLSQLLVWPEEQHDG